MINHSSPAINNPLLRINHNDFKNTLEYYKGKSPEHITKAIIRENFIIYSSLDYLQNQSE